MKRAGKLISKWNELINFYSALKDLRKGKTLHPSFIEFEYEAPIIIDRLIKEIDSGTYKVKPYRNFLVHEPKERMISAPHIEDRLVQHALMRIVGPIIDRKFIDQTYACRVGRGTHSCSNQLTSYLQNYTEDDYFLQLDMSKYFYSIDKDGLFKKVKKIIKCKKTLEVFREFIYSNDFFFADSKDIVYFDNSALGIAIGNYVSQTNANLMLNDTDHFAKRVLKCKHYLRYMDDIIILDNNKDKLAYIKEQMRIKIESENLKLNPKSKIAKLKQGVDFVGYRHWKDKKLIRKQSLFRLRKCLKKGATQNQIASFYAHSKNTNSAEYINKLLRRIA